MSERALRCVCVLTLLCATRAAFAHHVSIGRGTARVSTEHVTISLEVGAEDFLHYYGDTAPNLDHCTLEWLKSAARRHEAYVAEHLIVRDADGVRLEARVLGDELRPPPAGEFDWSQLKQVLAVYTFEYDRPQPQRLLTFQQNFGDGAADLPSQIMLAVIGAGGGPARPINLTSAGNVEFVELRGAHFDEIPLPAERVFTDIPDAAPAVARFRAAGLSEVVAAYLMSEDVVRAEIVVPWSILRAELPLRTADVDFLEVAEQRQIVAALTERAPEMNVLLCDSHALRPTTVRVALIGPLDAPPLLTARAEFGPLRAANAPRRLSAWTARVAVTLVYQCDFGLGNRGEVIWKWFNATVLRVNAIQFSANLGRGMDFDLTTYVPSSRLYPP